MSFWNIFKKEKLISLDVKKTLKTDTPNEFYNPSFTSITKKDYIENGIDADGNVIKEKIKGRNYYLVTYDIQDRFNPDFWIDTLTKKALTEDEVMKDDSLAAFPASSDLDTDSFWDSWDGNPSLDNDFDFASLLPCPDHIRVFNEDREWTETDFITGPNFTSNNLGASNEFGAKLLEFEIKVGKCIQISRFKLELHVNAMESAYEPAVEEFQEHEDFKYCPDNVIKDFINHREYISGLRFGFYLKHPQKTKDEFTYLLSAALLPANIHFITFVD